MEEFARGVEAVEVTAVDTAAEAFAENVCDASEETADTAAVTDTQSTRDTPVRVPVRFNHQSRELVGDEAIAYAQKGLKWEAFREDYDRLRFLAEGAGKSVSELIDGFMKTDEERELSEALACCNDEETARQLTALRRGQRMARFEDSAARETEEEQTEKERTNSRLAADYCALKTAVPEAPSFEQLPKEVICTAVEQGISLFDAYLRYEYEQYRLTQAAALTRRQSAQSSTGSLAGQAGETGRESHDFLTAFKQVFQ